MARDEALLNGLVNGRGEVHVLDTEIAGPWIVRARMKAGRRSLNEGDVLVDGDGVRFGRDLPDRTSGFTAHEGKR